MSQILKGPRDLTPEQAMELSQYIGLTKLESEYFLCLVERSRAGSQKLRDFLDQKLEQLRKASEVLKDRLPHQRELSDDEKATFYSDWRYSAVRMATDIEEVCSPQDVARVLGQPIEVVTRILDFLRQQSLVVQHEEGLGVGPVSTHIGAGSEFVHRHHLNWRIKSIEKSFSVSEQELMFTAPLAISEKDFHAFKSRILELIDELYEMVPHSKSEKVAYLSIDWLNVT